MTVYPVNTVLPSLTAVTVPVPIPPKNPVPVMFIVTVERFEPVLVLSVDTVGAGVVTVNLSADEVTLVPPRAATVISYVPIPSPAGITTPPIALSFDAGLYASVTVPSLTPETILLPTPPKKPDPVTLIVTGARFDPVFVLSVDTIGAGVVRIN